VTHRNFDELKDVSVRAMVMAHTIILTRSNFQSINSRRISVKYCNCYELRDVSRCGPRHYLGQYVYWSYTIYWYEGYQSAQKVNSVFVIYWKQDAYTSRKACSAKTDNWIRRDWYKQYFHTPVVEVTHPVSIINSRYKNNYLAIVYCLLFTAGYHFHVPFGAGHAVTLAHTYTDSTIWLIWGMSKSVKSQQSICCICLKEDAYTSRASDTQYENR